MALDLFRVDGGLQIEGLSQIMAGVGAPTHDAEVGSTYHRVDGAGGLYVKTAPGAGSDKWELQAAKSYVDTEIANVQARVLAL